MPPPFFAQGRSTNIVAAIAFTELLAIEVPSDATDGLFLVTGNISEDAAKVDLQPSGYEYSAADIRIVGKIGTERFVIASSAIGSRRRSWTYSFIQGVDGRNWQQIGLEARFILDGLTGTLMKTPFDIMYPTGVSPIVMELAASAFINRRGG